MNAATVSSGASVGYAISMIAAAVLLGLALLAFVSYSKGNGCRQ